MAQPLLVKWVNYGCLAWQLLFWFVALGGLAKLVDNCRKDVPSGDGFDGPVALGFATLAGSSGAECTAQYSWYFWVVFFQLICTCFGVWTVRLNTTPTYDAMLDAEAEPGGLPPPHGPLSLRNAAFANKLCGRGFLMVTVMWTLFAYDSAYHAVLTSDSYNAGGWFSAYNCCIAGASMTLLANFVFLATFDVDGEDSPQALPPPPSFAGAYGGKPASQLVAVHAMSEDSLFPPQRAPQEQGVPKGGARYAAQSGNNPLYYNQRSTADDNESDYDTEPRRQPRQPPLPTSQPPPLQPQQQQQYAQPPPQPQQQQYAPPQPQQQQYAPQQQQQQQAPRSPRGGRPSGRPAPSAREPLHASRVPVSTQPADVDRHEQQEAPRSPQPRHSQSSRRSVRSERSASGNGIGSSAQRAAPAQVTAASEERIRGAVDFLLHPSVRAMTDVESKRRFLEPKGLSEVELDEAMRRAGC